MGHHWVLYWCNAQRWLLFGDSILVRYAGNGIPAKRANAGAVRIQQQSPRSNGLTVRQPHSHARQSTWQSKASCTPPAQVRVRTLKAPSSARCRLTWFDRSRPVAGACNPVAVGTLSDSLSGGAVDFSPAACEFVLLFGVAITCAAGSRCVVYKTPNIPKCGE
jgi:hypothetical protein